MAEDHSTQSPGSLLVLSLQLVTGPGLTGWCLRTFNWKMHAVGNWQITL